VTTIDSHDQQVRTRVQTGLSDVSDTEIVSGLTPGQRIVVANVSLTGTGGAGTGRGAGGGFGGGFGGGRRTGGA